LDRVNGEWKGREQHNKEKEIKSSTTERKKEPHRSSATYHKEISRDLRKLWEYQVRFHTISILALWIFIKVTKETGNQWTSPLQQKSME